jgi:hypothetical protein
MKSSSHWAVAVTPKAGSWTLFYSDQPLAPTPMAKCAVEMVFVELNTIHGLLKTLLTASVMKGEKSYFACETQALIFSVDVALFFSCLKKNQNQNQNQNQIHRR